MKKNFLMLGVALCSVVFLTGCSDYSATTGETSNTMDTNMEMQQLSLGASDGSYNFEAQLPADWVQGQIPEGMSGGVVYYAPLMGNSDTFQENVAIARYLYAENEVNMTINQYADWSMDGYQNLKDYHMLSREEETVSGYPAVTVDYETTEYNDTNMRFVQTFIRTETSGYIITFTGLPDGIDQLSDVYRNFLNSIVIN